MAWTTLYVAQTILDEWVYSEPIQGTVFRLKHISNSNNTENFRGVIAQAFIEGNNKTILEPTRISFKQDADAFLLIQPVQLANRRLAIRRLDDSTGTWDIVVEVLDGMPEYLTLPLYINQIENLQSVLDNKAPITSVTTVELAVNSIVSELLTKADVSRVEAVEDALVAKADNVDVDELETIVETKASYTQLTTLQNIVDTKVSSIDLGLVQASIASKADTTDLVAISEIVNDKADNSDIDAIALSLNDKVNNTQFDLLADVVNNKIDITYIDTLEEVIETKANNSDLALLQTIADNKLTKDSNLSDLVNTVIARVNIGAAKSGINEDITQLTAISTPSNGSNNIDIATTEFSQQIYKPAFLLHCSAAHNVTTTVNIIPFLNKEIDTNSAVSLSQFTVPIGFGGTYILGVILSGTKDGTTGTGEFYLRCNNVTFLRQDYTATANQKISPTLNTLKVLVPGDVINVWGRATVSTISVGNPNIAYSAFYGYRLGI